ncbi:glycosyltransferase [Escherichia coli]
MNTHKVIAVIVTYRRKNFLDKVLSALLNQTVPLHKVIVVDNNSSDGTDDIVKEYINKFPEVISYHNTHENLGGAGDFYTGMKLIEKYNYNYDYAWLMDDDLIPNNDCLEIMLTANIKGIIQPMRFNLDGSCAELSALKYDLNSFFRLKPKGDTVKDFVASNPLLPDFINIETVPFEGPLIHKDIVTDVGLPDPRFFIFGDDTDYSIRTLKLNYPIICMPRARASRLLINNQRNDLLSWKGFFMLRNLFHLYFKHGNGYIARTKPYIIAVCYLLLCLVKGNFKQSLITVDALKSARLLMNNDKYKPKA